MFNLAFAVDKRVVNARCNHPFKTLLYSLILFSTLTGGLRNCNLNVNLSTPNL